MSFGFEQMVVQPVIDHFGSLTHSFVEVKHAWSMAPVEDLADETPLLLLLPGQITPGANSADNAVIQRVTEQLICLTVCKHTELDALRTQVVQALLGMQISQYHDAFEYAGGNTEGLHGQYIWWRDVFTTRVEYRKT